MFLLLLFTSNSYAGINFFGMNGKMWNGFSHDGKLAYTQGVFDGLVFSKFNIHGTEINTKTDINKYVSELDLLYKDNRNLLIPAPFLLRIVTLKINGTNNAAVKHALEAYRVKFSTFNH